MPGETVRPVHAPVEWAQRKDLVYITARIEDAKCSTLDITDDKLFITGVGGPDKAPFECNIEFYKPIDSSKVRRLSSDRSMEFIIPKKESGPFWPRLLKTTSKQHWLKVDFNKWKDEDDESDPENPAWDMDDMMGRMGGLGGGKPDLDDFDDDSDNAELPDLEDDKEEENSPKNGESKKTEEDEEAESATKKPAEQQQQTTVEA